MNKRPFIRFVNTSEPVTTLYRDLVPVLCEDVCDIELLVSSAVYREDRNIDQAFSNYPSVTVKKTFSGLFKSYTSAISKISVHFFYAMHGFFIMLIGKKPALQVFLTQPPFFYLLAYVIKKIRGIPYVIVIMDLQPDEYVEFGYLKKDAFYVRWLDTLSRKSMKNAEKVIVIGRCMKQALIKKGVLEKNIEFIPNWTSDDKLAATQLEGNQLRNQMGWENKFVILYGGNVGNAQLFEDFVMSAQELQDYPEIVLAIVGGGIRHREVQRWKEEYSLTNLELLPFLHGDYTLRTIYGAGNVNFISLRQNCTGHGVPSKAYVSLAAGRAILFQGSPDCEIARMVVEENIGNAVETREELTEAILDLYRNKSVVQKMGERAYELSQLEYSASTSAGKYKTVIEQVLSKV